MKIPERWQEWDRDYLPVAAARLRAWQASLQQRGARWREFRQSVDWTSPPALDARFGGLRPLAMVRELPQIGFIVIAVVLMAATGTAVVRHESAPQPSASDLTSGAAQRSLQLGPSEGALAADYTSRADLSVARALEPGSADKRTALVSLSAYRTPMQLRALLKGVQVRRVYLRAPVGGRDAGQFPIDVSTDLLGDLREGYAQVVRNRQAMRKSYLGYVATTNNDKPFQQLYKSLATTADREAKAYAADCACVFSAVVDGDVPALLSLRSQRAVRAIEVADEGVSLGDVTVRPLLPETTGRVPRPPLPGDPAH